MELPWNICPYCGTPAPGMRREHLTLDEALRPLPEDAETFDEIALNIPEVAQDAEMTQDSETLLEEFEEVPNQEDPEG